jgi:hypothetical protein
MVSLVDRVQELNNRVATTKNPNDTTQLEHEIEATGHQLVYELYGLTDNEIKIAEVAANR